MPRPRSRFSVRQMIVGVGIAAVLTACLVGLFRSVGWLRTPIELAPPPLRANTDHDLFDIVLSDLIANDQFRPAGGGGTKKFQIVVSDQTPGAARNLEEALGEDIKDVPAELRADLVNRNRERTHYSLARYQPSNPDILFQDMRQVEQTLRIRSSVSQRRGICRALAPRVLTRWPHGVVLLLLRSVAARGGRIPPVSESERAMGDHSEGLLSVSP